MNSTASTAPGPSVPLQDSRSVCHVFRVPDKPNKLNFGRRFSPYPTKKIDHSNVKEAKKLKDATPTYLNGCDRTFEEYLIKFKGSEAIDLKTFMERRRAKITVLDCGAGTGKALSTLLTTFQGTVDKCTGISMHYFKKVEEYISKHPGRLEWYADKAENVLPSLSQPFDLITDYFGAYFYSTERIILLNNYYRLLKDGGRAYIWMGNHLNNVILTSAGNRENLENSLVRNHPEIFAWADSEKLFLVITKQTSKLFSLSLKVKEVKERSWNRDRSKSSTEEQKREGQEYFPSEVVFEPMDPPPIASTEQNPK